MEWNGKERKGAKERKNENKKKKGKRKRSRESIKWYKEELARLANERTSLNFVLVNGSESFKMVPKAAEL